MPLDGIAGASLTLLMIQWSPGMIASLVQSHHRKMSTGVSMTVPSMYWKVRSFLCLNILAYVGSTLMDFFFFDGRLQ